MGFASWLNSWQSLSWHLRVCNHTFVAVAPSPVSTQVHSNGVPYVSLCLTPS